METVMIKKWTARVGRAMEIHRRRQILHGLPDAVLKDMGVARSEIDYLTAALVDGRRDPVGLGHF
jgi:uncharacterized protein YjiS (DUF1127 family)